MASQKASTCPDWLRAAILLTCIFGLVYVCALTFVYIEGDDAISIAYHVFGRRASIQRPYVAYQGMADVILGLFPRDERILRIGGMSLTAFAAAAFPFLLLLVSDQWLDFGIPMWLRAAFWVLAVPELLYLGLVYLPSMIAIALLLVAHLLARQAVVRGPAFLVYASAAVFGFGAAFRWDTVVYGAVVVADLLIQGVKRQQRPGFMRMSVFWGAAALLAWVAAVRVSGYGAKDIFNVVRSAGPGDWPPSRLIAAAVAQSWATPATVGFGVFGLTLVLRRQRQFAVILAASLLSCRFLLKGNAKFFITALPAILACGLYGFSVVWTRSTRWQKGFVVLLLLIPWLVGIRVSYADVAWGPGFELRPFDRPQQRASFELSLGAGAAVPTPEGPRGLWGHAWVFAREWRRLVSELSSEQNLAIRRALDLGIPLFQNYRPDAVLALVHSGFTTDDPWRWRGEAHVFERRFHRGSEQIMLLRSEDVDEVQYLASYGRSLAATYGCRVAYRSFSTQMRQVYRAAPTALDPIGPTSAVLNLCEMRQ